MRKAMWVFSGVVIAYAAYSLAPDMWRYWKMHTM